jgi:malonyl-CoA O-methyltransferase
MTVMDIAHGMTRQASQRLTGVGACDGDACFLPFRSEVFQTVISSSVYQWVARLPEAFCEVSRTLRPGGVFAVALFGEQTLCELKASHRRAIAACNGVQESHVQSFPGRDEVFAALQAADLDCLEIETYPDVDFHADVPALLRQLKQIGASNASRKRPRGLSSRRVMQKMISFYEKDYRCEMGVPATYEVILALACKQ